MKNVEPRFGWGFFFCFNRQLQWNHMFEHYATPSIWLSHSNYLCASIQKSLYSYNDSFSLFFFLRFVIIDFLVFSFFTRVSQGNLIYWLGYCGFPCRLTKLSYRIPDTAIHAPLNYKLQTRLLMNVKTYKQFRFHIKGLITLAL